MIDYFPDGHIDCKDYAIHNAINAMKSGASHIEFVVVPKENPNHVVIKFEKDGCIYVASNDKLYRTSCGQPPQPVPAR